MKSHYDPSNDLREPRRTTLLELVQSLNDQGYGEEEVVSLAASLVNGGRAILTGNFRGCRLVISEG